MMPQAIAAVAMLLVASVCSAAPRAVDVEQLDVAGVRLGMGLDEAVDAISKKLGVDRRQVEIEDPRFNEPNIVTNSKEPRHFVVHKDGARVQVNFTARVPYNPKNKLAVALVVYEQEWTPENAAAIKKMAREKYGEPSFDDRMGGWEMVRAPEFGARVRLRGPSWPLAGAALTRTTSLRPEIRPGLP